MRSSTTGSTSRSARTARRWGSRQARAAAIARLADAVVCAFGKVDGRMVCAAAYDFTVKGGSIGYTGRGEGDAPASDGAPRSLAGGVAHRLGGRAHRSRARATRTCSRSSRARGTCSASRSSMSGVVPQVAAMVGPGAAGTAYIPGLADYVPMVKGIGRPRARRAGAREGGRPGRTSASRSSAARRFTPSERRRRWRVRRTTPRASPR